LIKGCKSFFGEPVREDGRPGEWSMDKHATEMEKYEVKGG